MTVRRIFVSGGRGGCGKSTVAAGIACALSRRGVRTLLIDFDLAEPSLDLYLGCQDRAVYNLGDILAGRSRVSGAVLPLPAMGPLSFVTGAYRITRMPDVTETERLLSTLEEASGAETVVLDTSSVADPSVRLCATLCDLACQVAVPSALSLRSATSLATRLRDMGAPRQMLVVNRFATDPKDRVTTPLRALIDGVAIPLLGIVPECRALAAAHDAGIPVCLYPAAANASTAFSNMAARLTGDSRPLLDGMKLPRRKLLAV